MKVQLNEPLDPTALSAHVTAVPFRATDMLLEAVNPLPVTVSLTAGAAVESSSDMLGSTAKVTGVPAEVVEDVREEESVAVTL